ncbi:hypothetical protein G5I_13337 [Acromyrmex echinatior]|uniref:Uncharacterized protein n=1 Tax=Acromyrmex echinatior TaxID=103372 RepID=F4X4R5_ACREC|nr:hypothetical protein G5I_13337 [Acromyrmex echinatior]
MDDGRPMTYLLFLLLAWYNARMDTPQVQTINNTSTLRSERVGFVYRSDDRSLLRIRKRSLPVPLKDTNRNRFSLCVSSAHRERNGYLKVFNREIPQVQKISNTIGIGNRRADDDDDDDDDVFGTLTRPSRYLFGGTALRATSPTLYLTKFENPGELSSA